MSLSPHNCLPGSIGAAEFALPERRFLLALAHAAILSAVEQRELQNSPPVPQLEEPRGAFTTIYLQDSLRGCVGYVFPIKPLYQAVVDTARASCFEDARLDRKSVV